MECLSNKKKIYICSKCKLKTLGHKYKMVVRRYLKAWMEYPISLY